MLQTSLAAVSNPGIGGMDIFIVRTEERELPRSVLVLEEVPEAHNLTVMQCGAECMLEKV